MVQRKLVIKVQMTGDKCRTKALKLAAGAEGVTSVAIEGDDKSLVVVIGDEVNSVCLTRSLRKKVGYATIVSVAQLEESDEKKDEEDNPTLQLYAIRVMDYIHNSPRTIEWFLIHGLAIASSCDIWHIAT